jgi:DNA-binding NarL/FixJ family response regulator
VLKVAGTEKTRLDILIIDDHRMFADAMMTLFEAALAPCRVCCVASAQAGLQQLVGQHWQLVLLDLGLPDMDGLVLLQRLRQQNAELSVLVCTAETRPALLKRVIQAGASGLIGKSQSAEDVLQAVQLVAAGGRYLTPETIEALAGPEPIDADVLTERQLVILRLMQAGHSNREIAELLFVSANTVKTHVRLMFDKLSVNNRIECLRIAHERGYIH